MTRSTEAALARVVITWLEALGADVYQEVELHQQGPRADIVARVRAELWIVETKTSVSLALIEQAMYLRRAAHRVYVAAPAVKARAGLQLCHELGIGLLDVAMGDSYYTGEPRVRELAPSRRWNSQPVALAAKLAPEHKTHARAGAPTGGHWSPFRSTCEQLAREVERYGSNGITLKAAIDSIKHHYKSNAGARSSLATWIKAGKVPGVRIESGMLYPATQPARGAA